MGTPLNLWLVSEVRAVGLGTMYLTSVVCADSGWFASELNCGTAGEKL